MVKLRYFSYLPNGLWSRELEIQDVSIDGRTLDDRDRIHLFPLYNFKWPVGMLQDSELYKFRFVININGVYCPAWWILDHIAEVQVELDRIRTEELLEEIDR